MERIENRTFDEITPGETAAARRHVMRATQDYRRGTARRSRE